MKVSLVDKKLIVHLAGVMHRKATLKSWGGRESHDGKTVSLPLSASMLDRLRAVYHQDLDFVPEVEALAALPLTFPWVDFRQDQHPLWGTLFPFQRDAVDFLVSTPRPGALLALSPGLGKTLTSLVALDVLGLKNVLIVTTPTLLRTWSNEITRWLQRDSQVVWGGEYDSTRPSLVVTTYGTLIQRDRSTTKKEVYIRSSFNRSWDLVIFDESLLIKNRDSDHGKMAKLLAARSRRVWALSGSPTSRFADDLYHQLSILYPPAYTSYWRFAEQYCHVEETVWGKSIVGDREEVDLQQDLRDLMFVRNQKDVLPELPEILFEPPIFVGLGPQQRSVYDEMRTTFVADLQGQKLTASSLMAQLIRLQQISSAITIGGKVCSAKIETLVDLVRNESYPLPMLVWYHWKETGAELERQLSAAGRRVVKVGGDDKDRDGKIRQYLDGDAEILVLSLGVGKFGLTLTNTRTVVYVDKTFEADDYLQSLYRVKRIGLQHSPICLSLYAVDTTDDWIADNLTGKAVSIARLTDADVESLLKGLGR